MLYWHASWLQIKHSPNSNDPGINLASFFPCNQLTATSYIYHSLGDVEWYVKTKRSAWTPERGSVASPSASPQPHPLPVGEAHGLNHCGPLGSGMTGWPEVLGPHHTPLVSLRTSVAQSYALSICQTCCQLLGNVAPPPPTFPFWLLLTQHWNSMLAHFHPTKCHCFLEKYQSSWDSLQNTFQFIASVLLSFYILVHSVMLDGRIACWVRMSI